MCGAYAVTDVHVAVVLPTGVAPASADFGGGCTASDCSAATSLGASVAPAASNVQGPGLSSPQRSDALYLNLAGNGGGGELCTALGTASLGELTTGPASGGQLDAAALSEEGVGTPGYGLDLAGDATGGIPVADVRIVQLPPAPLLDMNWIPKTRWRTRRLATSILPGASPAVRSQRVKRQLN